MEAHQGWKACGAALNAVKVGLVVCPDVYSKCCIRLLSYTCSGFYLQRPKRVCALRGAGSTTHGAASWLEGWPAAQLLGWQVGAAEHRLIDIARLGWR